MRRALGGLFIVYAGVLATKATAGGALPNAGHLFMAMFGVAVVANVAGRFIRDWTLVVAGFFAYVLASHYSQGLDMPIHYTEQIDVERLFGFGSIPSEWLQQHLYHGRTGPIEIFSLAMYASHFIAPLALGFYIWVRRFRTAFTELMFAILTTSVLANIAFVLYPTAPPWLAAEHGGLVDVHHVLKQTLLDLHINSLASLVGDSQKYNIVAALPSLHAAFPIICLVVAVRYGLPRWLIALQLSQLAGVCFAIVYLGDHYVVDIVGGAAFAFAGFWIVHRLLFRLSRDKGDGGLASSMPVSEPVTAASGATAESARA
jgi:membrane-associated phospholipid phosphatase